MTVIAGLNTPDWSNLCSPVSCEPPSLATLGRCVTEIHTLLSVLVLLGTKEGALLFGSCYSWIALVPMLQWSVPHSCSSGCIVPQV